MVHDDRRAFQRLRLTKPILAAARGATVLILDIGASGALIEHYGHATPGEALQLSFRWMGNAIEFAAEVVHSEIVRAPGGDGASDVSHSGLRFIQPVGESAELLKDFIATFVGRVLAAQKANAAGTIAPDETVLEQLGHARRARTTGYVTHRLKDGRWWRIPTRSPMQPSDGFTVAAYEDDDEVAALCQSYEAADEEGRRLIRMVAELSVMS